MSDNTNNKSRFTSLNLLSKLDITSKFIITLLIGMSILAIVSQAILVSQQERSFTELLNSSDEVVAGIFDAQREKAKAALKSKAKNQAYLLAAIAPAAIAEFELSALSQYVSVVSKDADISYVAIVGSDDAPLATIGEKDGLDQSQLYEASITSDGLELGKVIIGYNFNQLNKDLDEQKQQSEENRTIMSQAKDTSVKEAGIILLISLAIIIGATIALVAMLFKWIVAGRLKLLENNLRDIAEGEGDLRHRVKISGNDSIDRLGRYFNLFVEKIHAAISRVNDASLQLTASSQQMSIITDESTSAIVEQQSETTQVATAINEMAATVQEVAKNASEAATAANNADAEAVRGKDVVNSSIAAIHKLAEEVENAAQVISKLKDDSISIGSVLDVIQGIAEQTNLLALNAAIEAARAGEQGRGFAVVADEVRTLAQRTQESTTEIQSMIESVQQSAERAVQVMESGRQQTQASVEKATGAGESFETITSAIVTINNMNTHIASAAEEQNSVADEINKNITQISQIAERTSENAQKTETSSTELASLSDELSTLMAQFKI